MSVYFCTSTGVRIVAPGVSKAVDPVNGQDEYREAPAVPAAAQKDADPTPPAAKSGGDEGEPSKAPETKSDAGPGAGSDVKKPASPAKK